MSEEFDPSTEMRPQTDTITSIEETPDAFPYTREDFTWELRTNPHTIAGHGVITLKIRGLIVSLEEWKTIYGFFLDEDHRMQAAQQSEQLTASLISAVTLAPVTKAPAPKKPKQKSKKSKRN